MAAAGFESLRTAKAALDEGLINPGDFDEVKTAFLRAQQIKAGLDAGFIRENDYQNVKKAFLDSLNMSSDPAAVASVLPASTSNGLQQHTSLPAMPTTSVRPQAPPAPEPAPPAPKPQAPPAARPPATNGSLGSQPAAAANSITPQSSDLPPAAQTNSNPVSATPSRDPSPRNGATVPTNIPKMGGARPKQTGSTSMSGISVTEDAVNLYYYLKAKSVYRWATWRINDAGNQVIISEVGDKDSTYQDFLDSLPASDCRYGVIDMKFTNSEGCVFNKILFVNWAPDTARIKAKMMYASTKDFFKGYLDGLSIELQGSDLDDISEQEASSAVRSSVTRQ